MCSIDHKITNCLSKASDRELRSDTKLRNREFFYDYVFNGLTTAEEALGDYEDAFRDEFNDDVNQLLERMQLWLVEMKNTYTLGEEEDDDDDEVLGSDGMSALDYVVEGFAMGLVAGDGDFQEYQQEWHAEFETEIQEFFDEVKAWLDNKQQAEQQTGR